MDRWMDNQTTRKTDQIMARRSEQEKREVDRRFRVKRREREKIGETR